MEDKVKRLDVELCKYKEQIKRTRPGPAQEAIKARAMRVLKQKKMWDFVYLPAFVFFVYHLLSQWFNNIWLLTFFFLVRYEGQRDMLYNQTFNLDQVSFAAQGLKDAQQTVCFPYLPCKIKIWFLYDINHMMLWCTWMDLIELGNTKTLLIFRWQRWNLLTRSWKEWWKLSRFKI